MAKGTTPTPELLDRVQPSHLANEMAYRNPNAAVEACAHYGSITSHSDSTITCLFCDCTGHQTVPLSAGEAKQRLKATRAEKLALIT